MRVRTKMGARHCREAERPSDVATQLKIRVNDDLKKRLLVGARESRRTLNGEIVSRLTESVAGDNATIDDIFSYALKVGNALASTFQEDTLPEILVKFSELVSLHATQAKGLTIARRSLSTALERDGAQQ